MWGNHQSRPTFKWGKNFFLFLAALAFGVRIALDGHLEYSSATLVGEPGSGILRSDSNPWGFWGIVVALVGGGFFGVVYSAFRFMRAHGKEKMPNKSTDPTL